MLSLKQYPEAPVWKAWSLAGITNHWEAIRSQMVSALIPGLIHWQICKFELLGHSTQVWEVGHRRRSALAKYILSQSHSFPSPSISSSHLLLWPPLLPAHSLDILPHPNPRHKAAELTNLKLNNRNYEPKWTLHPFALFHHHSSRNLINTGPLNTSSAFSVAL